MSITISKGLISHSSHLTFNVVRIIAMMVSAIIPGPVFSYSGSLQVLVSGFGLRDVIRIDPGCRPASDGMSQSESSIQVTWSLSTNHRPASG